MLRFLSGNTKEVQKLFLKLPKVLYLPLVCPQNKKEELAILNGTHAISNDIEVHPFVVANDKDPICRCLMTYYPNDDTAYVGFFESTNNPEAVCAMFKRVEEKAKSDGKKMLLGPINSSIYIGYRFKTSGFDKVFTGEPYNHPHYAELWEKAGFIEHSKYVSNYLRQVKEEDLDPRMKNVYQRYVDRGYQFVSTDDNLFVDHLEHVYDLMMESYSKFDGFKKLTKEQFISMFSYLGGVVDHRMVKLAYNPDNELKAFCVCIPNYGEAAMGKMTPAKLMRLAKIKKQPSEYVIMYVGADRGAVGLGSAIVQLIRDELYKNQCTSIGALIKEGNLTGKMYDDLYVDQSTYVLLSKSLS